MPDQEQKKLWNLKREKILLTLGILVIVFEVINAEVLGRTFHAEIFWGGLALCGIGIIQAVDRR